MLKTDMAEVLFPFLYKREGEKILACNRTRPVYQSCPPIPSQPGDIVFKQALPIFHKANSLTDEVLLNH